MITVDSTVNTFANLKALQAAAAVQFGVSYNDCNQTRNGAAWTVYLTDNVANQQALWDALVNQQDPVYVTCDKSRIKADDTERCTITVTAPKPGAAAVVLSISCNGSAPLDFPVSLAGGVGSDFFTCKDPASITIRVKNGANRSVDTLTVEAT